MYITIDPGYGNPVVALSQQEIDISIVELGVQGPPGPRGIQGIIGPQGDNLDFNDLTEQQKIELRADVGDTNINYTNIFLASLLS